VCARMGARARRVMAHMLQGELTEREILMPAHASRHAHRRDPARLRRWLCACVRCEGERVPCTASLEFGSRAAARLGAISDLATYGQGYVWSNDSAAHNLEESLRCGPLLTFLTLVPLGRAGALAGVRNDRAGLRWRPAQLCFAWL
jgi:hypothetical protein